jgi:hypothetical protein
LEDALEAKVTEQVATIPGFSRAGRRRPSLQMKHRVVVGKVWVNVDPRTHGLVLVADMNRNIFYIIGVIVVIVIVLKVLGLF